MVKRNLRVVSYSAKDAIEMWCEQYGPRTTISKKLRALKRPTKSQVQEIIDVDGGWTTVWCVCCHEYHPRCVSFGGDYSDEVCEECLRAALDALQTTSKDY